VTELRERDEIVAVGLLTRRDLDMLGSGFRRAFPLEQCADFDALLKAIDAADKGTGANRR
jgi:hypothetical protein